MRYGVLGTLIVTDDEGVDHTPRGDRQRLLLATLLASTGALVSADRLVEELWGDDLPANPAAALQNQISRLRRLLDADGAAPLYTEAQGYRLVLDPGDLDAERFERLLAASEDARPADPSAALAHLDAALELWRGEAYGELSDRPWVAVEAARLEELRASAREVRGEILLDMGRPVDAVATVEGLAAAHPLRERPQHLLMRALYAAGRQSDALATYQRYRKRLGEELGLDPSPELARLEAQILRHELHPGGQGQRASLAADAVRPPRPPPTSFVGREADLAGVLQRLASCRLVTICGTGGVGKTRLALEAAAKVVDRYPDGVHVVELARVPIPADVPTAVASALRVPQRAGASVVDRLVEALAGRKVLVVLDNCEHVLDGAAALVEPMLRLVEGVDVLATSRAALAVDGEHVWPLVPLAADGASSPATRLFADRAQAASPGFVLSEESARLVEGLCRQLDGIPLALELAAARLRVASLDEVAAAVEERSELLAGGRRTAEPRHRSLEALVEWSYHLLEPDERRLFARLSVFQGAFAMDDVVVVASGDGLAAERIPALLWSLVDQSLVVADRSSPEGRYSLLETLHRAARQRLEADGSPSSLRRRHAELVLSRAAEAASAIEGSAAPAAMAALERLLPELRAARRHLEATDDLEGQLRLSASLFWYGFSRIHSEVLGWTTATALRAADEDHPLAPSVLGAAAAAAWQHGDLASARRFAELGVGAAQRLGDPPGSDRAFNALSEVALFQGDVVRARQLAAEARVRAEATGGPLDVVYALAGEAQAWAYGGEPGKGLDPGDLALLVAEGCGSPLALAWAAYGAGEVRLETEPRRALALLDRAVGASREVGERMVAGVAALSALTLRSRLGELDADLSGYRDLIEHWRQVGAWTLQWTTLRNLVEVLARRGEEVAAARLLGASEVSPTASLTYGAEAQRLERTAEALRWKLGERFEAEVAAGRRLGDEGAVALAQEVARRHPPSGRARPAHAGVHRPGRLDPGAGAIG